MKENISIEEFDNKKLIVKYFNKKLIVSVWYVIHFHFI